MGSNVSRPAALLFTEQELGGPCYEQDGVVNVGTAIAASIQGNGERVGILMINQSPFDMYVSLTSAVSTSQGILLGANGGLLSFTVRDDFTLPTRQWFAVCPGANGQSLYVLEIIRYKQILGEF